jgi:hypothetical protein
MKKVLFLINHFLFKIYFCLNKNILLNINKTNYKKNCLINYIPQPFFFLTYNEYEHQNHPQLLVLSKIIKELGYNIDVTSFNSKPKLNKKYDLVIDINPKKNKFYEKYLNSNSKKILYLTGSSPTHLNRAEKKAINIFFEKKKLNIIPKRKIDNIPKNLSYFDAAFLIGDETTLNSYKEYRLPQTFLIKNTGYNFLKNVSSEYKKANVFLYLGGNGQLLKGLDIILDTFSKNNNLKLYVCSNFNNEPMFKKSYYNELFKTKNIIPVGQINIKSNIFRKICEESSYLIFPSSSEGMSGSVLTAMSAGLIPIITKETGISSQNAFYIKRNEKDINKIVTLLSKKDKVWISKKSNLIKKEIEKKYSITCYENEVKNNLKKILL